MTLCGHSEVLGEVNDFELPLHSSYLQLSLVEYDPETHDLKTLSLHYFEEEELKVRYTKLSINHR